MRDGIKLIKGDCLEKMKNIPDKSVDMILCDLPYGTTACRWDTIIPLEPLWEQYNRIIKDGRAIVLFGCQPFTSILIMSNIKNFKYEWVWDKHIPRNFLNAKRMPMQKHENIVVFSNNGKCPIYYPQMTKRDKVIRVKNYSKKGKDSAYNLNINGTDDAVKTYEYVNPDTIIVGKWEANKGKVHPTQKPVSLLEYLIETYTLKGETVLDNTMGSGSTGVACVNTNRNFIGIELDDKYFEIASKRIEESLRGAE